MNAEQTVDNVYPVDIVLERRRKRSGRWEFVDWQPAGVLAGRGGTPERQVIHDNESCRHELWTGFSIRLVREAAASYWSNLMADQPSVFVICRRNETNDELRPFLVTVDYDEVVDYQDVGDDVFRLALPKEIYQWVERFVVNHCEPPKRGKRKRARWNENDQPHQSETRH